MKQFKPNVLVFSLLCFVMICKSYGQNIYQLPNFKDKVTSLTLVKQALPVAKLNFEQANSKQSNIKALQAKYLSLRSLAELLANNNWTTSTAVETSLAQSLVEAYGIDDQKADLRMKNHDWPSELEQVIELLKL